MKSIQEETKKTFTKYVHFYETKLFSWLGRDPESSKKKKNVMQNEKSGILFPQVLKVVFRKLN